ncbi:origin recognition complex subunit 3 [Drosophila grimshawi]|uniref:Origin recognition complex subunit 3 n=1 Tax=Drosophila grimshawi TaxID=7222 RepID=B4K0G3_DROGR|nr:origin recognition complex subunit 3 [Drosophila grimshawi]XP_043072292.1 origin recognition complex subunit 3 [Drosophila grimshawi]EDV95488.1 GH24942 [Drosophila grimshawi]
MDPTISVSKGCFVYKNGATRANKKEPSKRKRSGPAATSSLLGKEITTQPFYAAYSDCWKQLHEHIQQLQMTSNARTLEQLVEFVGIEGHCRLDEVLPTAALLTGINQPDHLKQFETLTQRLHLQRVGRVSVLQSRDCATLKAAIESMVYSLMYDLSAMPEMDEEEADEGERDRKRLRRTQCTLKQLHAWYSNNFGGAGKQRALVIVLPDFECFNANVLQDFILILSAQCERLPFVLILGVATAMTTVHSTLPYHVSSKIKLRVFQTQAAPTGLNEVLDKVLLSPKYAFHLSGKAFKFLTHIFLYYDFSIQGFIQGFKYCLMEHYFAGNAFALCTGYSQALGRIKQLSHEDMETIRRLPSFRPYVEQINDCKRIIAVLTDDEYLKKKLPQLLRDCLLHFMLFRCSLEFFTELVGDLPRCPLGKLHRELYVNCLNKPISQQAEYKECWQILSFMSKEAFVAKLSKCISCTEHFLSEQIAPLELGDACAEVMRAELQTLKTLLNDVELATLEQQPHVNSESHLSSDARALTDLTQVASRQELKAQLLQRSKQDKQQSTSEYARALTKILAHIEEQLVLKHLRPLQQAPPLHELYVFTDIATVRRNIIGAPRAALHTALNNPHFYMQCKCCELQDQTQLVGTMPDLSVVYKLHLECGRMINLFDWLQAFRSVLRSADEQENAEVSQEHIDPQIQARFTRAVAELQFLGYIKMSKRKTDHATRLTW